MFYNIKITSYNMAQFNVMLFRTYTIASIRQPRSPFLVYSVLSNINVIMHFLRNFIGALLNYCRVFIVLQFNFNLFKRFTEVVIKTDFLHNFVMVFDFNITSITFFRYIYRLMHFISNTFMDKLI